MSSASSAVGTRWSLTSDTAGNDVGPLQGPDRRCVVSLGFHPRLYRFVAVGDGKEHGGALVTAFFACHPSPRRGLCDN
jgi:hypothetical protein